MKLFETKRLLVRQLSQQDTPELTEILSDPEVMKYSIGGVCDECATRKFVDWCIECYSSKGVGPWALIEKEACSLVGFCGVSPELVGGVEEMNLGYRLATKFWNRGLATEAVRSVLKYCFDWRSLQSVVAIIEPGHTASFHVVEKAGLKQYTNLDFHGRQVRLYRITSQAWYAINGSVIDYGKD